MESPPHVRIRCFRMGRSQRFLTSAFRAARRRHERACSFDRNRDSFQGRGDVVIREGDPSNFFYVMLEGELRVTKFFDNQEIFSWGDGSRGVLRRDSNPARRYRIL